MHRISTSTAMPNLFGAGKPGFRDGNKAAGVPATELDAAFFNALQEELLSPMELAGLEPDAADNSQLRQMLGIVGAATRGAFKNLTASSSGTNATVTYAIDEICVGDGALLRKTLRSVALAISAASAGVNGLDTGVLAASTWYSVWVIHNPVTKTTAGLLSLSATAPTLPAGYTLSARVGWIRTDATVNKYPLSFIQFGRRVQYKIAAGSNVAGPPLMASGIAGNTSTPSWVAIGISAFVPPTASAIGVTALPVGTGSTIIVAPNASYGAAASTTNPAPIQLIPAASGTVYVFNGYMSIESTNIYWASVTTGSTLCVSGWEDNL